MSEPLDDRTRAYIDRLFELNADADRDGIRVVANGSMAIISALHMSYEEQRVVTLLLSDVVDLVHAVRPVVRTRPRMVDITSLPVGS
jgi:ribose 1,5-bisphosphokinase PhnN